MKKVATHCLQTLHPRPHLLVLWLCTAEHAALAVLQHLHLLGARQEHKLRPYMQEAPWPTCRFSTPDAGGTAHHELHLLMQEAPYTTSRMLSDCRSARTQPYPTPSGMITALYSSGDHSRDNRFLFTVSNDQYLQCFLSLPKSLAVHPHTQGPCRLAFCSSKRAAGYHSPRNTAELIHILQAHLLMPLHAMQLLHIKWTQHMLGEI